MKEFTAQQVEDIIKLKFGKLVTSVDNPSFVSNRVLGQIYGDSGQKIRELYLSRFDKDRQKSLPLSERMRILQKQIPR